MVQRTVQEKLILPGSKTENEEEDSILAHSLSSCPSGALCPNPPPSTSTGYGSLVLFCTGQNTQSSHGTGSEMYSEVVGAPDRVSPHWTRQGITPKTGQFPLCQYPRGANAQGHPAGYI